MPRILWNWKLLGLSVRHFTAGHRVTGVNSFRYRESYTFPLGSYFCLVWKCSKQNVISQKKKYKAMLFFSTARVSVHKHGRSAWWNWAGICSKHPLRAWRSYGRASHWAWQMFTCRAVLPWWSKLCILYPSCLRGRGFKNYLSEDEKKEKFFFFLPNVPPISEKPTYSEKKLPRVLRWRLVNWLLMFRKRLLPLTSEWSESICSCIIVKMETASSP
jgi:hypothetical protein